MSILPVVNPQPIDPSEAAPETKSDRPTRPKKKGKNYGQIHAKPLPLEVHPLPAFHPSNPLSLLRLAYTWISHILFPQASHPAQPYIGHFSPETRSVHVTSPDHVRALWEMGFFGKGSLSRSEPNWLEREKARLRREKYGAEDATNARREERRLFKLERARLEAEKIERQRLVEEGKLEPDALADAEKNDSLDINDVHSGMNGHVDTGLQMEESPDSVNPSTEENQSSTEKNATPSQAPASRHEPQQQTPSPQPPQEEDDPKPTLQNQEHLTLTLEESFFLSYALGVLRIYPSHSSTSRPYQPRKLLELFITHTPFPPTPPPFEGIVADDPFLLNYIAYHHFRSLGWVVRSGIKFGTDYLLYARGPAISHAEFGVLVIPAYTHRFWNTPGGRLRRRDGGAGAAGGAGGGDWGKGTFGGEGKDWWLLHAVNRVQSQVKKTLVLCYVDVPSPLEIAVDLDVERAEDEAVVDIGRLLRMYTVREFVVRRWVPNRSRD